MARSKMVTTTNPDLPLPLPRQSSVCSLSSLLAEPSSSLTMDDLLLLNSSSSSASTSSSSSSEPISLPLPLLNPNHHNNNINTNSSELPPPPPSSVLPSQEIGCSKTLEDVWKVMVRGPSQSQSQSQSDSHFQHNEITLEDFLSKPAPDVTAPLIPNGTPIPQPQPLPEPEQPRGGPRGKRRRPLDDALVDKATLQKQKRMIKNRESAARSRERKQAYTVELEAMVVQLEEENARLLKEQDDQKKQRYKQLMECLIPVVEERKPRRKLRRVNSVHW